jgi:basic membrane protein A
LLLVALIVAGCSSSGRLKVGLAYAVGGPGDHGFNDSALAGLNRAQSHLDGKISSVRALSARPNETEQDQFNRLSLLCKAGYDPVIAVGFTYAGADPSNGPLARAAKECPDTHFAIVDDDSVHAPNVANLVFADEQGSYLMGIVAATKATSNVIGFVGACPAPVIDRFLAGYQAGARSIKPDIAIKKAYLSSDPRKCDFTDVDAARTAAAGLYAEHADVVYQAAGGAGLGVFEAAKAAGKYAIGAVKHVDVAVDDFITSVSGGLFKPGVHRYDLSDEGESYATSGNAISQLTPQLDAAEKKIISGAIVVPTAPTS